MTNANYATDEWTVLRDAPHAVGLAVALAGASGFTGTMKEAWSSASAILEGMKSDNEILRRLATKEEAKAAQSALREAVREGDFKTVAERVQELAIERASAAMALLVDKGRPGDVEAYRTFLQGIGERVASAAKEGSFLGIGGERVSEGERAMLARLDEAIG